MMWRFLQVGARGPMNFNFCGVYLWGLGLCDHVLLFWLARMFSSFDIVPPGKSFGLWLVKFPMCSVVSPGPVGIVDLFSIGDCPDKHPSTGAVGSVQLFLA